MNLEIKNLEKNYQNFLLKNINIKLPKGKIIGFIGENGSGKTTTIKSILNLISIDSGNIKIFEKDNKELTNTDKEKIGVVLDDSFFSYMLTIEDINNLMKKFYTNWDQELFFKYVNDFKLPHNKIIKSFSSGMKMKLKVICAISHNPQLLILDEPTNGLDPVFRYDLLNIFENFVSNKENSIFISSHITSDLDHIADEIIFINNGEIFLDMDKEQLINKFGIIDCKLNEFNNYKKEDIYKYLKYKDIYMLLTDDRNKFKKKYPKTNIKDPNIEDLMLLFIKGEN